MAVFEFDNEFVPQNSIEIEETGNFALEAINEEEGFYFYLLIKTSLGTTTAVSYGPVVPDFTRIADGYKAELVRFSYKEEKLNKFISKWLNDREKHITAAKIINQEDAMNEFRDLKSYIENYSDEVY
jgi:hypothetical protein